MTRHTLPETRPDAAAAADDLLQATTRTVILMLGGVYMVWHVVATLLWPQQLGAPVWATTAVAMPPALLALWLLPRWRLAAWALWQFGIAAGVTLAVYLLQRPEIAFLYALLPLTAVAASGWKGGLLAEGLVAGAAWWMAHGLLAQPTPPAYPAAVLVGAAVAGLIGWSATYNLSVVTQWSLLSFAQAQQHMQAAQAHRAQLAVMLKDLDSAYYRLERANAALVAARKVAEDAERFKAEFVANVSHELRTPLNLIVGFSEVIMTSPESYNGVALPGPYRSDVNAIYRSAQHLLALVDDVLDLARIEAGRITLTREEVDLTELVTEAADTMRDYIAAKGLELRLLIAPGLPRLWVDRLRIRQVLLNLLVNAARFTERGSITIEVALEEGPAEAGAQRPDEPGSPASQVLVTRVIDTGRGIPERDLPKMFEEFRSTEQPVSTWHSGTGLGLPISKKFTELHRGQMGVTSVYGRGTTFWFALPTVPVSPPPTAHARWQPVVGLRSTERIIVVVHDDARIAALIQRYLDGYQIVGAASWQEGLRLAQDVKAIALLADGAGAPTTLPDAPPVVLCRLPSRRHAAIALGARDLLVKPIARQDLLAAIDRVGVPVRRVLIVDDDPKIVRLFQRMLRTHATVETCLEAYNGAEALEIMRRERPDLVLLDLVMPGGDGHSVLEGMAAAPDLAETPVIVVSAQGQDHLRMPLPGPIQVYRAAGFNLGEEMRLLEALFSALAPGWGQLAPTAPGSAAGPPASPAL